MSQSIFEADTGSISLIRVSCVLLDDSFVRENRAGCGKILGEWIEYGDVKVCERTGTEGNERRIDFNVLEAKCNGNSCIPTQLRSQRSSESVDPEGCTNAFGADRDGKPRPAGKRRGLWRDFQFASME